MGYILPEGIDIADVSGLENSYQIHENGCVSAVLGADKMMEFLYDVTKKMAEPVFFFLELPLSDEEEKELHEKNKFRLFYLDNCTKEVVGAIIRTYGELLVNDGLCRFGFGENELGGEVYVQSFNVISVSAQSKKLFDGAVDVLKKCGAHKTENLITPWDVLSQQNQSVCAAVDEDGFTVFDIPEALKDAGMYFSQIV